MKQYRTLGDTVRIDQFKCECLLEIASALKQKHLCDAGLGIVSGVFRGDFVQVGTSYVLKDNPSFKGLIPWKFCPFCGEESHIRPESQDGQSQNGAPGGAA